MNIRIKVIYDSYYKSSFNYEQIKMFFLNVSLRRTFIYLLLFFSDFQSSIVGIGGIFHGRLIDDLLREIAIAPQQSSLHLQGDPQ